MIRRTALVLLTATLMACSGTDKQSEPVATTGPAGPSGAVVAAGGAGFDAGCAPLKDIEQYLKEDSFNTDEVKKIVDQVGKAAAAIPDEATKQALLALAAVPLDEARDFSDAYSSARQACTTWNASFSGGQPQDGNTNSDEANAAAAAKQEEVNLFRNTCEPVIDIAKSFQEGTLDLGSVPATVEDIAPRVADVTNTEAKDALQALVEGVSSGTDPMSLFASAVQTCGAWGTVIAGK